MNAFGTTLGKALYRIKVTDQSGQALSLWTAFKRAVMVWFRGLALGIPFITLFTQIIAYEKLSTDRQTTWDRDLNLRVTIRYLSAARVLLLILAWVLLILICGFLIVLGASAGR
jgi:hypothetical protein